MYKGYKSYDIYYDNVNMYLKGYKGVLEVPFYRVRRVKMTFANMTIMGFKFYQYKIDEFEGEVRKHNPDFIVEHWT